MGGQPNTNLMCQESSVDFTSKFAKLASAVVGHEDVNDGKACSDKRRCAIRPRQDETLLGYIDCLDLARVMQVGHSFSCMCDSVWRHSLHRESRELQLSLPG